MQQALLSPEEFVRRAVGIPWVRWRSDWFACDCYGLVLLWLREVQGINFGTVPQTDIETGFAQARNWVECGPDPGASAFMAWRNCAPTHCGILATRGLLLHAQEGRPNPEHGSVRATRIEAMASVVQDIRFYRPLPPC